MAYDNNQPTDNILIRLLSGAIRNNFQSIQSGDTTFSQEIVNLNQQGSDPANVASTFRLYSKSSGGNTELFGENSAGTVYQLTGNTSSSGSSGYTVINGLILINWGSFTFPNPLTTTLNVTFPKAYSNTNYQSTFGEIKAEGAIVQLGYQKTSGSVMTCRSAVNSSKTFSYIAIGPV